MKRMISALLTILAILSLMTGACALNDERHYDFILTYDGESAVSAAKDEIVTVTLLLKCVDTAEDTELRAFQTELCYDDEILEYVGNSTELREGVEAVDICTDDFGRRIRVSYALPGKPKLFRQKTEVMSFDFKVLKEVGSTRLTQENYLVSNEDGTDIYESSAEDFIVVTEPYVIPQLSVVFEALNGEDYEEVLVMEGEPVTEPETVPVREGYVFSGWYTDNAYTTLYDFTQPVENSMTLYAKWDKLETPMSPWILYAAAAPFVIGLIVFLILRKRDKDR